MKRCARHEHVLDLPPNDGLERFGISTECFSLPHAKSVREGSTSVNPPCDCWIYDAVTVFNNTHACRALPHMASKHPWRQQCTA